MQFFGRLIFGGYWLMNGWSHFSNAGAMSGYAASKDALFYEKYGASRSSINDTRHSRALG